MRMFIAVRDKVVYYTSLVTVEEWLCAESSFIQVAVQKFKDQDI